MKSIENETPPVTPADEEFIALRNEGLETTAAEAFELREDPAHARPLLLPKRVIFLGSKTGAWPSTASGKSMPPHQGLEVAKIAHRPVIPRGTVQSWAHCLQQRGLIQPRPKGGASPRQKALARQDGSPAPPVTPPPTAPIGAKLSSYCLLTSSRRPSPAVAVVYYVSEKAGG